MTVYFFNARYVDDCILIIRNDAIESVPNIFNSINKNIQFTFEIEFDENLPFLNFNIIRNENDFPSFDWYVNSSYSGRILNHFSYYDLHEKRSIVIGLIDKVFTLYDPKFRSKNLRFVRDTLIKNCYPSKFVNDIMKGRLKKLYYNYNSSTELVSHN